MEEGDRDEIGKLLQTLPKKQYREDIDLYLYQGTWNPEPIVRAIVSFQRHFQAHDTDVILATAPKSGTTWLKAVAFAIVNRSRHSPAESPLLTTNPHELVPLMEHDIYLKNPTPDLESYPHPRIFSTHLPYGSLPASVKSSNCRVVFLCRNPLDLFISYYHFIGKIDPFLEQLGIHDFEPRTMEEEFELFCQGFGPSGPFWDHMLGFWNANVKRPNKVLFMRYEDMKRDITFETKRLAEFLGYPFSPEEESWGSVEEITRLCSFEKMSNLAVNKAGKRRNGIQNKVYFRRGEVGDWENHLSPSMIQRIKKLMEEKFEGSGLTFQV